VDRRVSPAALLAILTGLNLLNYVDRYVLGAVRTPMANTFGLDYGASGRVFTAFMLGYFLTAPLFGFLGDRGSRKALIGLGVFTWSLGTVLTGLARSFSTLLWVRATVGVGEASYGALSPGLISDTWAPGKRNMALTIFYVSIPVGAAVGYALGGLIAARWGWQYAFFWAGGPGLLLALILLPFKEPERGESEEGQAKSPGKAGVGDVLRLFVNGNYGLVVWGYVAYTFALGAFAFWGPTFFQKVHGLPLERADSAFGAVLIVTGIAGSLLGGLLATMWQKRTPAGYALLLCSSVLAAVPASFWALTATATVPSMAMLALSMFLLFFITGPVNTLILELVPVNVRSSAMAISIFMIHLFGDLYSPEAVGRLADRAAGGFRAALLVLPGALLVASLFWMILALRIHFHREEIGRSADL
jgi:MFS transporter, Spinster family, sphingosine-1-phosphate transporter